MAQRSTLAIVAAVTAAITLSASRAEADESRLTIPGTTPPAPAAERFSDARVRSELRRLNAMKTECSMQARQALAAQQSASAIGRTSEAEAQGQILWSRMRCVEQANQGFLSLQDHMTRDQLRLLSLDDRFHQEYRQGLQSHLNLLQHLSQQLADPRGLTAESFGTQMEAFRRQRETFKNHYIRLLNDAETHELSTALFQAGDLLIGSAQVWRTQVNAEATIAELTSKGASPALSRAEASRETAAAERARQWETAQRLILRATALTAPR